MQFKNYKSKAQYTKVPTVIHNYITDYTGKNELKNTGEAVTEIVSKAITLDKLGLNKDLVSKLEMVVEISQNNGKDIDLKTLLNRMVETAISEAVNINEMDKSEVLKDSSINVLGSAKIRINHFVDMIKEHNTKSDNKLMISQTLISKGIGANGKRIIDLDKILASDKSDFVSGCGSHRNAIKAVVLDNGNFDDYNAKISDLTPRSNNMKSIKALEKSNA